MTDVATNVPRNADVNPHANEGPVEPLCCSFHYPTDVHGETASDLNAASMRVQAQEARDAQIESYIIPHLELAGSCWLEVAKLRDGAGFRLSWNDGVANAWSFDHGLLSVVLLRLATLTRCAEYDFTSSFETVSDEDFTHAGLRFLATQTTLPAVTWHGGPAVPKIDHVGGLEDQEWRLWIPPTSIWCFEGGKVDSPILGVWGNTYHASHSEACEFLTDAITAGLVW